MTEKRPLTQINKKSPGSDVAAEAAAAMAAASMVFKSSDTTYSDVLLQHAQKLFTFADTYRGLSSETYPKLQDFYNSTGYVDELLWAASWLYHATGDQTYLSYVTVQNGKTYAEWEGQHGSVGMTKIQAHRFVWAKLSEFTFQDPSCLSDLPFISL